jgi:transcriptional regulator with XRE-family HTH domain
MLSESTSRARQMKPDNPTSRDIADAAGVSQATVSRALRNSPLVRQETRDRIHKIARELNYFVNRNAAGLRTHQSDTIALLLFEETKRDHSRVNPIRVFDHEVVKRKVRGRGCFIGGRHCTAPSALDALVRSRRSRKNSGHPLAATVVGH